MKRVTHYGHLSIKFLDVMFGAVIALGFNEWFRVPEHTYQSLLTPTVELGMFIFSFMVLIDVWIKYDPTVRQFPTKHPHMLIVDLLLVLTMFFLVHSSIFDFKNFMGTIVILRSLQAVLSQRVLMEYKLVKTQLTYFKYERNAGVAETLAFMVFFLAADKLQSIYLTMGFAVVLWAGFRMLDMKRINDVVKLDD